MSESCNCSSGCQNRQGEGGVLRKLGLALGGKFDRMIALAGNPNTGKSTVFNRLTGLRQHTGNWPGKTVGRAEGIYQFGKNIHKLVDLPGTYSLLSTSTDEEIARDFLLFDKPDCVIVVVDATALERNLNLVFQVLEISRRVVVCVNLLDEARRKGIRVDLDGLALRLGVPCIGTSARSGRGISELLTAVDAVASGSTVCDPQRVPPPPSLQPVIGEMAELLSERVPGLPNARWVALRVLEGDASVRNAIYSGELLKLSEDSAQKASPPPREVADALFFHAERLRKKVSPDFRDRIVESLYSQARQTASETVTHGEARLVFDHALDKVLTHPVFGLPVMLLMLCAVFYLTVTGANIPSAFLAGLLIEKGGLTDWFMEYLHIAPPAFLSVSLYEFLASCFVAWNAPSWFSGVLLDGAYLCTAWVISVMLPPMMIFFPLFTLLEDFGYLPRVAFNLDPLFRLCGAHGKQALTMCMGFGCNAAGVIACRIIDSPREKILAILTNNFMPCNGRFPTLIAVATLFVASGASGAWVSLVAASAVMGIVLLGALFTFATCWVLNRTVLRGEPSAFTLELPPYRIPSLWSVIYRSMIDRTVFVLWRAIIFAAPCGVVIWLAANLSWGGTSLASYAVSWLDPLGWLMGLSGVILLAYIVAIPANEIIVPTCIMLYVCTGGDAGLGLAQGRLLEIDGDALRTLLTYHGWTTMTAVCLMLFCLLHNPCSTTVYTIWKETHSRRWTALSVAIPLALGFVVCSLTAAAWRFFIWF